MNTASSIRLLAVFVLALSLATLPVVTFGGISAVRADFITTRINPTTQWVPAGPAYDKLQIQVYTDELAEWNGALSTPPQVDLTDWPLQRSFLGPGANTFGSDARFWVTQPNAEFGMFDLDFNHANTFWGIDDLKGNSPAGIQIRQGIAHLLDKLTFITGSVLGGLANPLDNAVPPGQGILHPGLPFDANSAGTGSYISGGQTFAGVCGWDSLHGAGCLSAYHYAADTTDSLGIVNPGQPDFCDAADHFIAAGLATVGATDNGKDPVDCHLLHPNAALSAGTCPVGPNCVVVYTRSDSAPRRQLGLALTAGICKLINGAAVASCNQATPFLLTIQQAISLVFPTSTILTNWHIYTAGWGLGSQFDQLWALYHSRFAGSGCGGHKASFGQDYTYYCRADYDTATNMLEFNDTLTGAIQSAQVAMEIFGKTVATIPIWSQASQFSYLKGWTGINDATGVGPPNFYAILNAWNANPATACGAVTGCGGSPGILRWAFKQGVTNLNPYFSTTLWEFYALFGIYDSLLASNPYSPTDLYGWMANQFQILPPQAGDPAGTVQDVKFNLRNNLFWHDGVPVTASDIKFTILTCKATAAAFCAASTTPVLDVTIQNDFNFLVNMNAKSPFTLFNVGGLFIFPQHVLAADKTVKCTTAGTNACTVDPLILGANADVVRGHTLIGSGSWVCKDLATGQVGGGCTSSGSQAVDAGGTIVLQRAGLGQAGLAQTAYFRDSAKYKLWQWADVFGHGTVDIIDVSNAAGCLNKPASTPGCAHWDAPAAFGVKNALGQIIPPCTATAGSCNAGSISPGGNANGLVEFIEVSQAFGQFGFSWTQPIPYNNLVAAGAQPIPQTLYEGGITYGP